MMRTWICFTPLLLSFCLHAGIQPASTRIIYPAERKEVTFKITNNATTPRLIQTWIDIGDEEPQAKAANVPFLVMPPIFRIDPDRGQTLRILFLDGAVPPDRESVFWLNILELQPTPVGKKTGESNVVQFSIRTRIKLFYRPQGLPGSPDEAVKQLQWRVVKADKEQQLQCENPTAFNISFHNIQLQPPPKNNEELLNGMCPAKGTAQFTLQEPVPPGNGKITITTINDFGGFGEYDASYSR
jgi:chaperone protein EcpD